MSLLNIDMRTLNKLLLLLIIAWLLIFMLSCKSTKSVATTEGFVSRSEHLSLSFIDSVVLAASISCDSVVITPLSVDSVGDKTIPRKIVYHGLRAKIEENNVSTMQVKDTISVTKETKSQKTKKYSPGRSAATSGALLCLSFFFVLAVIVIFVRKIGR